MKLLDAIFSLTPDQVCGVCVLLAAAFGLGGLVFAGVAAKTASCPYCRRTFIP